MDQQWKTQIELCPAVLKLLEIQFEKWSLSEIKILSLKNGQGKLLQAYFPKHKQNVALKISINPEKDFKNLQQEYEMIKLINDNLDNSLVIKVLDKEFIEEQYLSIIVFELCKMDLKQEMKQLKNNNQWYTEEQKVSIILQLSHGLSQIHCYNIIHGDIKPQNILISQDGVYKICDFGFSKKISFFKSDTKKIKGFSYDYVSPEIDLLLKKKQKEGIFTCQTDVYSMGLIFLEILGVTFDRQINQYILEQKFAKLQKYQQYKDFEEKYPLIKDLLFKKCFLLNPKERINSYELIYELLQILPQNHCKFEAILNLIEQEQQQEIFQNDQFKPFQLQMLLKYSFTMDYIYNKQNAPPLQKGQCYQYIGWVYYLLGENEKSIEFKQKALEQLSSDIDENKIILYKDISISYQQMGRYQEALKFVDKSLDLADKISQIDNLLYADCVIQKANCLFQLNDLDKALQLANKQLKFHTQMYADTPNEDYALILHIIGRIHHKLNNKIKSIEYLQQSLKVLEQLFPKNNHPLIPSILNNLAVVLEENNELNKSLEYYQKSLELYKEYFSQNPAIIAKVSSNITEIRRKLGLNDEEDKNENVIKKVEIC